MNKHALILFGAIALISTSAFAKTYTYTVKVTNNITNAIVHGFDQHASPPISDTPIAESSSHTFKITDDGKSLRLTAGGYGHQLCDIGGHNMLDFTFWLKDGFKNHFNVTVSGYFNDPHHFKLYCY